MRGELKPITVTSPIMFDIHETYKQRWRNTMFLHDNEKGRNELVFVFQLIGVAKCGKPRVRALIHHPDELWTACGSA